MMNRFSLKWWRKRRAARLIESRVKSTGLTPLAQEMLEDYNRKFQRELVKRYGTPLPKPPIEVDR